MDRTTSNFRVTVFGSSQPKAGQPAYLEAYQLGRLLGTAGYSVLTGGYIGTMEAVSRGASETGGHVIGVTCDEIQAWRPVQPNPWIQEEWRYPTLRARLYKLIDSCQAAIALPGGVGTLAEISVMWSQMQISPAAVRPLILVGAGWAETFQTLWEAQQAHITSQNRQLIQLAPNVQEAFGILQSSIPMPHSPLPDS